jgi:glycosyltransferase involved in cell wall biosynthesis
MKIWLITVGEPLPVGEHPLRERPYRTGLLAEVLGDRGHHVTWWTSTFNHQKKEYFKANSGKEVINSKLDIYFLHGRRYKKNVSFSRLYNHFQIASEFRDRSRVESKPDLIVCSLPTLELAYQAALYAEIHNVPLVVDVRDLWPDVFVDVVPESMRFIASAFFWPYERMAKKALASAHSIVGVSKGYLTWGLEKTNRKEVDADNVFPLGYPNLQKHPYTSQTRSQLERLGIDFNRPIVWFIGSFVKSIDLEPIIKVASVLQSSHPEVQFVFSGQGEDEAHYRDLSRNLSNIVWTGWVSQDEIALLGSKACVGLAAYRAGAFQSLPNKLFEYMSFGLPVLSSLQGEAKQFLFDHKVGLTYQSGNAEDCVMRLKEIIDNPFLQKIFARNASTLFNAHYNAQVVYEQYATHLESIAKSSPKKAQSKQADRA